MLYIFENSSAQIDAHIQYYWDCLSLGMYVTSLRSVCIRMVGFIVIANNNFLLTGFKVLHFAYCSAF